MMRILLIYAHPLHSSYIGTLFSEIKTSLINGGHDVISRDLYAENFNPTMSPEEWLNYNSHCPPQHDISDHVNNLRWCDVIIFMYPTWWYGMPAIMKGYLDRVWAPGIAFELDSSGTISTDSLSNIKRFLIITTHGSSALLHKLWFRDASKLSTFNGIKRLLPSKCRTKWIPLYNTDKIGKSGRINFTQKVIRDLKIILSDKYKSL